MNGKLTGQDDFWQIGQKVFVGAGPFFGFEGIIALIDWKERKARININVFGRLTPVEVPFASLRQAKGASN